MNNTIKTLQTVKNLNLSQDIITDVNFGIFLLKYLGTISIIRPELQTNDNLFFKLNIYDSPECKNLIKEIDSKNSEILDYCKVFFNNNNEPKWITLNSSQTSHGLGPDFTKYPLIVNLGLFLIDKQIISSYEPGNQYYITYIWYSDVEGSTPSDVYSMVWPAFAEC